MQNTYKIAELISALPESNIMCGDSIGADFGKDEYPAQPHMPDAVIAVKSVEEISNVMSVCSRLHIPVTVRGAGTGKVGGCVAINGGVVLSMRDINKISDVDAETKTVVAQAGALLCDVKAAAAKHGLCYPPDPGEKTATVGGNASTNASGPCALKHGTTRDYIADAVVIFADGSVAKLSEAEKYSDIIGSEGTLAVIAELTLRLVEKPSAEVILLLPFEDAESCVSAAKKISEAGFEPSVLEYIDTDIVEFSGKVTGNPVFPVDIDGDRAGATLMLALEGVSDDELDEKMESLAELSEELECFDILVVDSSSLKREVWEAYDAFHTSVETAKNTGEINVDVPASNMAELVAFAKSVGAENGLNIMVHGHVGSGGLHLHAVSDSAKSDFVAAMADFTADVYGKCVSLGGSIVGEYGVGYSKRDILKKLAPDCRSGIADKKAALDPDSILNPGKVV